MSESTAGFGKLIDGQPYFTSNNLNHPDGTFAVADYVEGETELPEDWKYFKNRDAATVFFSQPIDEGVPLGENGVPVRATMLSILGVLNAMGKFDTLDGYMEHPDTPRFHKVLYNKFGPNDPVSRDSDVANLIGAIIQVDMDMVYLATLTAKV